MFHAGSNVEIKGTENVLTRFPELVGKKGTIVSSPTHPSTWFTVRVEDSEQTVKLQPTAMNLLGAETEETPELVVRVPSGASTDSLTSRVSDEANAAATPVSRDDNIVYDGGHQRAKSLGHVIHCSLAPNMKKGCSVTILRTENVLQRAPHLVGKEGVVKEAPVHPATWFKVEFPDKSVFTFRPSALVLTSEIPQGVTIDWSRTMGTPHTSRSRNNSGDAGADCEKGKRKRKRSEKLRAQASESEDEGEGNRDGDDLDLSMDAKERGSRRRGEKERLLSSYDQDCWVGMQVRVKGTNRTGTVLKTGNGWVQLATDLGEMAKRAYELLVISDVGDPANESTGASRGSSRSARTSQGDGGKIGSYRHTSTLPSLHIQIDCAPRRPRSYSDPLVFTPTESTNMSYYGLSSPKLFLTSSPRGGDAAPGQQFFPDSNLSQRASKDAKDVEGDATPVLASNESETSSSGSALKKEGDGTKASEDDSSPNTVTKEPDAKKEYFIKKVNPLLLQARKEYTEKYVHRTQEKLENRPDLTYWKRAISSAIMVDSRHELENARREVDECLYYCPNCLMERWEGGMFCWNENCKVSPIYWRLAGARGKPVTPRKQVVHQRVTSESREASSEAVGVGTDTKPHASRRVGNKKWKVSLLDNVPSVNGNNFNYLPYHKNDDVPAPFTGGKDVQEYNYYYEHAAPRLPRENPIVSDDLLNKPFAHILDGEATKRASQAPSDTPLAVAELNLSSHGDHTYVTNDEANRLCGNRPIFADEVDDDI